MTTTFLVGPISRVVDGVRPRLKALVHATECPPCTGGHQNGVNVNVRSAKATTNFCHSRRLTVATLGSWCTYCLFLRVSTVRLRFLHIYLVGPYLQFKMIKNGPKWETSFPPTAASVWVPCSWIALVNLIIEVKCYATSGWSMKTIDSLWQSSWHLVCHKLLRAYQEMLSLSLNLTSIFSFNGRKQIMCPRRKLGSVRKA